MESLFLGFIVLHGGGKLRNLADISSSRFSLVNVHLTVFDLNFQVIFLGILLTVSREARSHVSWCGTSCRFRNSGKIQSFHTLKKRLELLRLCLTEHDGNASACSSSLKRLRSNGGGDGQACP